MNHQFVPFPHQLHRRSHRTSEDRQQCHLDQQSQTTGLAQDRTVCVTIQRQRPEQHARRTDDIVPPQEGVHAQTEFGHLQGRLSPWQRKLKDLAGVEEFRKLPVEETRLDDRGQGDNPGDQVGEGSVSEGKGVDFAQGAEGCATTVDGLIIAHQRREEDIRDNGKHGNVYRPGLPDGDANLFQLGSHGLRERDDQQRARNQECDDEHIGNDIEDSARDANIVCVGSSCCHRESQLQSGVERGCKGKGQRLREDSEDKWAGACQNG